MQENQSSLTALMCAYFRAHHAMHDTPKIFDDFLAYQLIPQENRLLIEQGLASYHQQKGLPENTGHDSDQAISLAPLMQAMGLPNILSRARYAEDSIEKAVKQGVQQYVILGAGMDTFAFRRPDLSENLRVIEIDHPNTQNFKLKRIVDLGWKTPKNLQFIPVDFAQENLITALNCSSYDPQKLSFYSWLGVTMYLTRDEVFSTLRSIAAIAPSGSTVIFDYYDTEAFIPEKTDPQTQEVREALRRIGEPVRTGFDPSALAAEMAGSGFRLQENLSPADIQNRYFLGRADSYHAGEHVHFALALTE